MNKLRNTQYATYIKKRLNADILEDDTGFVIYSVTTDECFIHEMSVRDQFCGKGYGKSLIAELEQIALIQNCKFITATVQLFDKGAPNTLIAAFKTGFELAVANNQFITIIKKIGGA